MSDEFTTNENGSKTPEKTKLAGHRHRKMMMVQNETSQITQRNSPENFLWSNVGRGNSPNRNNAGICVWQAAYQQAYQSEQSQPNAYQQGRYGQTQAKGTGTGFGVACTGSWNFICFLHLHASIELYLWQCLRLFSVLCRW